jgi:hypothetical protein
MEKRIMFIGEKKPVPVWVVYGVEDFDFHLRGSFAWFNLK